MVSEVVMQCHHPAVNSAVTIALHSVPPKMTLCCCINECAEKTILQFCGELANDGANKKSDFIPTQND